MITDTLPSLSSGSPSSAVFDLPVAGMSCASCAGRVENALTAVPGVRSASVNLATDTAHLDVAVPASLPTLIAAVEKAGYQVPLDRIGLQIEGMSCASCVGRVEKALQAVAGVQQASVNLATERAEVAVPRGMVDMAALVDAVRKAGYAAQPVTDAAAPAAAVDNRVAHERHLALLSLALAAPLVLGMIADIAGYPALMLPPWMQFAIATPVQFLLGWRFYRAGWSAIRAGTGNMDLLVALGTTAAWGLSTFLWWRDADHIAHGMMPHLYYEGAVAIIAFVRLGKWLEARAKGQTVAALRALMKLRPAQARRRKADGSEELVDTALLGRGDLLVVRAGEAFAADGDIVEGRGSVDESMLTGESLPVEKTVQDAVHAGTLNRDGLIVARVTATGGETMLSRIVHLVESAQASKPPIQKRVDRISAIFVPVVIFIALITFTLTFTLGGPNLSGGDAETALLHAIAVLVIACPCALGLATPAALMVGTGLAAKHGILIRDAAALEAARDITLVAFDKTGTLTQGQPAVTDLLPAAGQDAARLLQQAATLQGGSQHPLAQAVRRSFGGTLLPLQDFRDHPGRGISGMVDGLPLLFGNRRLMQEQGIDTDALETQADALSAQGRTVSWLASLPDRAVLGLIAFGDEPKPTAAAAIARLHGLGIRTVMLSGDNRGAAQAMAARLGIDQVEAEILPQDKAKSLASLAKAAGGTVAMVGDGINDAPALAAADVGIAMGTGTDVAMQTAGITLMRGDPALVADAIAIARATDARIRQNLFWAFAYNLVGIPLAAFGLLNPVLAGAAMALSSVSVLGNALLLKRWKPAGGKA